MKWIFYKKLFKLNFTFKWRNETDKRWRLDINLWENSIIFFGIIKLWKYGIWHNGKIKNQYSLRCKTPRPANYFIFKKLALPRVGKKEFYEKYKGNKYSVPDQFVLDLTRD